MKPDSHQALAQLFKSGEPKRFEKGQAILDGEYSTGTFFVRSGFVKVFSISDDGDIYLQVIYKRGELFPLIWTIKSVPRKVFYEAMSDVVVWTLPRETVLDAIHNDPAIASEILHELTDQFHFYADRLDNLQYKSATERVIYRLLFLAYRFGERKGAEIVIRVPLTHDLIAQSINLARETVSRVIEELESEALVGKYKSFFVITDVARLATKFSEPVSFNAWGLNR